MFDKNEIKKSLSIQDIFNLVTELGGEPQPIQNNYFISRTICHNLAGQGSYKLYYYDNGEEGIFHCYTDCLENSFDIFELVRKQKTISTKQEWSLYDAIAFVAYYFGFSSISPDFNIKNEKLKDWDILDNYKKNNELKQKQIVELKIYDSEILRYFPKPIILPWEEEGINRNIMIKRGIAYDPINEGILIPHYDINNNLVGIRERTLIKEKENFGKYKPVKINKQMYNHPLSFVLYNLNNSKDNIRLMEKAIVFESEKSCLKYASFMGEENDISVACCGSNLISYQVELLLSLGVKEIIVGFDRQYQKIGDTEYKQWVKKLKNISKKYSPYCTISFLFDTQDLLDYKDAPVDKGKEVFLKLFKNRLDANGQN